MAHKNAVAKQQDSSRLPAPQSSGALASTAHAFNLAFTECVRDPNPDAVHRLRTGSRRLQALLEAALRDDANLESAKTWLRPLKQVRRAAGAVRDLDVHSKLLQQWLGKEASLPQTAARSSLAKQAKLLDEWLQSERKQLARGVQKQIRKRQPRLATAETTCLFVIGSASPGSLRVLRSADTVALEDFVRAADAMHHLDAENLHDFRKAIKKARYVAECDPQGETNGSVAKALKRVQDAIGEWHDRLCLQQEAQAVLKEDAPELSALLEREVERHFAAAMKTTQTMRARLTGEWMALQPARRPPVAVTGEKYRRSLHYATPDFL